MTPTKTPTKVDIKTKDTRQNSGEISPNKISALGIMYQNIIEELCNIPSQNSISIESNSAHSLEGQRELTKKPSFLGTGSTNSLKILDYRPRDSPV